jgi:hypothetical protein
MFDCIELYYKKFYSKNYDIRILFDFFSINLHIIRYILYGYNVRMHHLHVITLRNL